LHEAIGFPAASTKAAVAVTGTARVTVLLVSDTDSFGTGGAGVTAPGASPPPQLASMAAAARPPMARSQIHRPGIRPYSADKIPLISVLTWVACVRAGDCQRPCN